MPWHQHLNRGQLGAQYDVIQRALGSAKLTAHRESPADITGITLVFGARIDQHQITIAQLALVFGVMQNTGVITTTDDAVIGSKAGTMTGKLVLNFPFQMVFEQACARFFHRAAMGFRRNLRRGAHQGNFRRRFEQAHLVHQRTPIHLGIDGTQPLAKTVTQRS